MVLAGMFCKCDASFFYHSAIGGPWMPGIGLAGLDQACEMDLPDAVVKGMVVSV